MAKRQKAIDVDSRGRTSLAKIRAQVYDRYLVEELPDGTLVLTPAVTITAEQARRAIELEEAADLAAPAGSAGEARADGQGPWIPVVKVGPVAVRTCPHGSHTVWTEAQACGRQLCADASQTINHLFYLNPDD